MQKCKLNCSEESKEITLSCQVLSVMNQCVPMPSDSVRSTDFLQSIDLQHMLAFINELVVSVCFYKCQPDLNPSVLGSNATNDSDLSYREKQNKRFKWLISPFNVLCRFVLNFEISL